MAVETEIPFTSIKPGQVILARLSCGADAIGKVMAESFGPKLTMTILSLMAH
ncbi:hypothetical protein Pmar_PMAR026180 [Perkinsus marinus ATCC 50983]|uniref:Uncharacterized protein n=1 Tax=Perkinsus marinus (strain ATCC 50983 / TXsc) TaxID=423536 RepID=C5LEI1_PERM5|nr:hypothetical protein Pmar_PMAR026180 [Perkinsus marinus ATCC 50983]EER04862.1 hypothetical protein Pmar_PMAR026180 [Perkinsus marinus ATCC 50983]|eukprot:XP_002773046.1 hypothetical protein Pmar_PMAR026180 [Perkinsus marinus ATCC 50983]